MSLFLNKHLDYQRGFMYYLSSLYGGYPREHKLGCQTIIIKVRQKLVTNFVKGQNINNTQNHKFQKVALWT